MMETKNILMGFLSVNNANLYILSNDKITLGDITFKTMKNNTVAKNHIILSGNVNNLIHFVVPLRIKTI